MFDFKHDKNLMGDATEEQNLRSTFYIPLTLLGLAVLIFMMTVYFFSTVVEGESRILALIFALAVIVVAIMSVIVFGRLWTVWKNRRVGIAGSRLHIRLVSVLSGIAILPTVIAFVFSALILQTFSQEFFVDRVSKANNTAINLANTYFNRTSEEIGFNLVGLAVDLSVREQSGRGYAQNPIAFRQYLYGQTLIRGWEAIYLLDGERRVLARVEREADSNRQFMLPNVAIFDEIDAGTDAASRFNFDAQDRGKLQYWRATLKIKDYNGGYLVAFKREMPLMSRGLLAVRDFRDSNESFAQRMDSLQGAFTTGYGLLGLIILLFAVWIGLLIATAIVSPVGRLASAAENISTGDLSARVQVKEGDGELGDLGQTFNHMAGQLESQRDDLISSNKQSDERRRFIEAVLSGVSAGVLGVSKEGKIIASNQSAADFLGVQSTRMTGMDLNDLSADLKAMFEEAVAYPEKAVSGQVEMRVGEHTHLLNVRVGADRTEDSENFVITFDDITELISAQRNAAWGDVARRIAHEIKNPLTPIQLSAERLKRKYGKEITSNPEVFDRCTDTIIRHVNDIGRMVNEFSSFARMPEAVMSNENIREIIKSAAFPFQVAHPDIEFIMEFPEEEVVAKCDGRLIVQACTNLIKNAIESIEERTTVEPESGKLLLRLSETDKDVQIDVFDNGKGLPENARHRLTEPYMTTREKGTGLGLAIVRKVIEEHDGRVILQNVSLLGETGARVTLVFKKQNEKDEGQKDTIGLTDMVGK